MQQNNAVLNNIKKGGQRYVMLDILRILCAFAIFGRHAHTMGGFSFGSVLNNLFINSTSSIMSCFFILSGFSLFIANYKKNLFDVQSIKKFYWKRAINILPIYWAVHLVWIFFKEENVLEGIFLTPLEILGLQSIFESSFGILHNGGTWFISCIILAYIMYPYMQELLKKMSPNKQKGLMLIITILIIYLPYVGNTYSNPFYRGCQFLLGSIMAALHCNNENTSDCESSLKCFIGILLLVSVVTIGNYYSIALIKAINVIFIGMGIVLSTKVIFSRLQKNDIIQYLAKISYGFYILQSFLWTPSIMLVNYLGIEMWRYKVIVPFVLLLIITILVHEIYEKPIQKILKKKVIGEI